MGEARECQQCGTEFMPRREHARFCSARCRMAWNHEHASVPGPPQAALGWSIIAMADVVGRLGRARAWDLPRTVAAVSEATWWVTIVDATLVRYHPGTYDSVLASYSLARRQRIEGTLAGLRYVRNQMGHHLDTAGFIRGWSWNPLPAPVPRPLSARGQEWEMTRYDAYQARLAGRDIAETFALTAGFLSSAAEVIPPSVLLEQHFPS